VRAFAGPFCISSSAACGDGAHVNWHITLIGVVFDGVIHRQKSTPYPGPARCTIKNHTLCPHRAPSNIRDAFLAAPTLTSEMFDLSVQRKCFRDKDECIEQYSLASRYRFFANTDLLAWAVGKNAP